MAMNGYQWSTTRAKPDRATGLYGVDAIKTLATQLEALNRKVDKLTTSLSVSVMRCNICGGGHTVTDYSIIGGVAQTKQVEFVWSSSRPQGNPYNSTYNLGWRKHPNFAWSAPRQSKVPFPPGF